VYIYEKVLAREDPIDGNSPVGLSTTVVLGYSRRTLAGKNEERRQYPSLAELARERLGVRVPTCTVSYGARCQRTTGLGHLGTIAV
jgi:hypothetical protein